MQRPQYLENDQNEPEKAAKGSSRENKDKISEQPIVHGDNAGFSGKSVDVEDSPKRNSSKVLVIYTGGTIGMMKNKEGLLSPQRGLFESFLRSYPQLHDTDCWENQLDDSEFDPSFLVLPGNRDIKFRILYKLLEYEELLDSSNMTEVQWIKIAENIMEYYEEYDGFVILHGTDTISYTASALSFMFENIGKCVVITGAQIPIFEPRSDGVINLVSSLLIAGGLHIPEVTVFFGNKLFRGNRVRKISAFDILGISSPNCPPLVEMGVSLEFDRRAVFKPSSIKKCHLHAKMSKNVGLLSMFPSITSEVIKAICQPPIEGIVLLSYGSGNIPTNRQDVIKEISSAVKRGVIVVNITQCTTGSVASPLYETGKFLASCGVVSGYDMTPEAALTKLSYVLSETELCYQEKVELMSTNIRGELTNTSSVSIENNALTSALAASLNIHSPSKLMGVTEKVFDALLLYAVEHQDECAMRKMLDMGADVNAQNSEGRTPLHDAIVGGKLPVVEFLLRNGANVHLKTRSGETPLITAIHCDDLPAIKLLLNCGAHLSNVHSSIVAELLAAAARTGSVQRLEALRVAGADLNIEDDLNQNALHKAIISNPGTEAVQYLLRHGTSPRSHDLFGRTPRDYALEFNRSDVLALLEEHLVNSTE